MKEILISQFIDDELNLKEKRVFVEHVKKDDEFYQDTLDFIDNEIVIREHFEKKKEKMTEIKIPVKRVNYKWMMMAALLVLGLLFTVNILNINQKEGQRDLGSGGLKKEYRFVIYDEKANSVELTGTFTNWEKVPMKKIEGTNYWEVVIELPKGEHRYSFITDGKAIADPTALYVEKDDFGNVNSILEV